MRNVSIKILLFIGALTILSCSSRNNHLEHNNFIQIDLSCRKSQFPLSSFIYDIYAIKLELPTPYFFGVITDVLFTDSTLFVVDKKQGNVFRFKKDGTFLNRIGNRGGGPGEFLSLYNFFTGNQYVFISDLNIRQIHCYTHDGEYVKSISSTFELVYDDIAALPNGKFLCHDIQGHKNESKIWLMNEKGDKEKTLLFHENNYPYSYTDWNTISTTMDNKLNILDPISGIFYLYDIEKNELAQTLHLVSEEKDLSAFRNVETLSEIKDKYAYLSFIINTDNYLYSIWSTSDNIAVCSLYEKGKKNVEVFGMPKMDFPDYSICPIPVSTNLPNAMVAIMTDEYPLEYFPKQYRDGISEQVAVVYVMKFK